MKSLEIIEGRLTFLIKIPEGVAVLEEIDPLDLSM